MSREAASEASPLLGHQNGNGHSSLDQEQRNPDSTVYNHENTQDERFSRAAQLRSHLRSYATIYLCALFILATDVPGFIAEVNRVRLYELAICRDWYSHANESVIDPNGDIPEELCKIRAVQRGLADFSGFQMMLDELVGMIVVVPYGILADVYGRKLIASLALTGLVLGDLWTALVMISYQTFPTKAAFASSAFRIIGGGQTVIMPIILAMASDAIPAEMRTRVFFYLNVFFIVTELTAPPLGSWFLITIGPHLTFLLFTTLSLSGLIVLASMPETLKTNNSEDNETEIASSEPLDIRNKFQSLVAHVYDNVLPLLSRPVLFIALMALFVNRLPRPLLGLLLQFMSAKFHWKLAQSNYLLSLQALIQLLTFLLILPAIQSYLTKTSNNPQHVDLRLSRGSVIFLVVGTGIMGLAMTPGFFLAGLCINVLGNGYPFAMRSYLTSLVHKDEVAFLYTVIAIFEGVGRLVATPLLAKALAKGIDLGGHWLGLPFFIVSILYILSGLVTWHLPVFKREEQQ